MIRGEDINSSADQRDVLFPVQVSGVSFIPGKEIYTLLVENKSSQ